MSGYYLADKGRDSLEKALSFHPSWSERVKRFGYTHLLFPYFCGILFITLLVAFFGYTQLICL